MYIDKIDELIDSVIDDFYNYVIINNKDFLKISTEPNFVKYQKLINNILTDYFKNIDKKEISEIITNQDNIVTIIEIIKRYICYYLFLTIGFFYETKRETFINNII